MNSGKKPFDALKEVDLDNKEIEWEEIACSDGTANASCAPNCKPECSPGCRPDCGPHNPR